MRKLSLFLNISIGLTALLAGYLFVGDGFMGDSRSQTGTLLEKFDENPTSFQAQTQEVIIAPILISSRQVTAPSLSAARDGVIFYEKNNGKIFEINEISGEERILSTKILPDFLDAIWSPDKKSSLNSYRSGSSSIYKHFDIFSGKETPSSSDVQSMAYSLDGKLVSFFTKPPKNNLTGDDPNLVLSGSISISQPDGAYQKKILNTRLEDASLSWPILDKISVTAPYAGVFLLTEEGKMTKILENRSELKLKWSPSGNKLLFSFTEMIGEMIHTPLWLKDLTSGEERYLNLSGNASDCAWSIDDVHIFCPSKKSPSIDEIYTMDSTSGSNQISAEPNMLIKNLFLSPLEEYIYFVGVADDKLYKIKISD